MSALSFFFRYFSAILSLNNSKHVLLECELEIVSGIKLDISLKVDLKNHNSLLKVFFTEPFLDQKLPSDFFY